MISGLLKTRLCVLIGVVIVCAPLLMCTVGGCSAVQTIPDHGARARGFLHLLVKPASADIFIDGDYQGVVHGWVQQTVPVKPGHRRLELRAQGYIAQRFDIDVHAGEIVTLRLQMVRHIQGVDGF